MKRFKGWEYYEHIENEIISNEIYILLSLFGSENRYLIALEKFWFEKRDLAEFRTYIEDAFEKIEVEKKEEVDRDSLSCLLRLMAICDTFTDYSCIYDLTRELYEDTGETPVSPLTVYDYSFKQFIESVLQGFYTELSEITPPLKYKTLVEKIINEANILYETKEFNKLITKSYEINDLISDLLDLLEDDSDGERQFQEQAEVVLYNFAIYYSTKFYFGLLLRERIIYEEEKLKGITIENYKPLMDEDDLRLSEMKSMNEDSKEIFYKTLKN
ncbi:hypothetical protein [Spiroplasma culicicola]|uniref:Uncharacterized protein n=1 Tax=Spiroplasma culicicola AES-1 TaxID=1276246 RepID=W6A6E1_9MOLU|nr:hypothetical protein [Spiroplasma culicicola]AHI52567.1 hypothetical protein SCULI_v1c02260 [Spiroplasma culicicola AES-1]